MCLILAFHLHVVIKTYYFLMSLVAIELIACGYSLYFKEVTNEKVFSNPAFVATIQERPLIKGN